MRVAGGKFGGRALTAPKDDSLRPTADKVRQAIFNVLEHKDFGFAFRLAETRVLYLFAGTGAMGIEALSRGARFALFVDDSATARALIRENVERLGLTGVTKIWRRDARALGRLDTISPFGLAFLDPPYRKALAGPALLSLGSGGWLERPALVVVETAEGETVELPEGYTRIDERSYGETQVLLLSFR